MKIIKELRKSQPSVVVQGLHPGIIQSMLDYDTLLGRTAPTVKAIIARGRKKERFFWEGREIEIPLFPSLADLPAEVTKNANFVVNVQSSRNVLASVKEALERLSALKVISVFAEGTPEVHALTLQKLADEKNVTLIGPSSVGLLIPGCIKLGAIGGTMHEQIVEARIIKPGNVAIVTTSGGMVNELIRVVTGRGQGISFAVALGGDRYPMFDPVTAVLAAEADPQTKEIVFFGELGGNDEHAIAELIQSGAVKKRMVCYIAGVVAELFETPPQFGHAKALAQSVDESASAKKEVLRLAGAVVCERFDDIAESIEQADFEPLAQVATPVRRKALFMSHISGEKNATVQLLGKDLLEVVNEHSMASLVLSMLLGRSVESPRLAAFIDTVMKLLVDHSPNVSGAINTMVTARAGKDLVSSLSAGLLTIGPRFGGAINEAASGWIDGVGSGSQVKEFVDNYSKKSGIIAGIGHKKYRIDLPDPRVAALTEYVQDGKYIQFARAVESVTTNKKANLILNVDGAIAAVLLDLLVSELNLKEADLRELVEIEFFNALFVISRTIGFTAHYLDQRRNDEGLFRLPGEDLLYIP